MEGALKPLMLSPVISSEQFVNYFYLFYYHFIIRFLYRQDLPTAEASRFLTGPLALSCPLAGLASEDFRTFRQSFEMIMKHIFL